MHFDRTKRGVCLLLAAVLLLALLGGCAQENHAGLPLRDAYSVSHTHLTLPTT